MGNKLVTADDIVGEIHDGSTIVMGGSGAGRKPLALVCALAASDVRDLTVVAYNGSIDVDVLIGAGKVGHLIYSWVGLDSAGLAPHFRKARQAGSIQLSELSEELVLCGLSAGARRMPFGVTRSGLGTDVGWGPFGLKVLDDPFGSGQKVVAVPAIRPDVALLHVNAADSSGFGQLYGQPWVDKACAEASGKVFLSCERVISTEEVQQRYHDTQILRLWTTGVVELPQGAAPTSCHPDYPANGEELSEYAKKALDPEWFTSFIDRHRKY